MEPVGQGRGKGHPSSEFLERDVASSMKKLDMIQEMWDSIILRLTKHGTEHLTTAYFGSCTQISSKCEPQLGVTFFKGAPPPKKKSSGVPFEGVASS